MRLPAIAGASFKAPYSALNSPCDERGSKQHAASPTAAQSSPMAAEEQPFHAAAVALLLGVQAVLMRRLLRSPCERAPWYNATGTTLYVLGMLASALAIRGMM